MADKTGQKQQKPQPDDKTFNKLNDNVTFLADLGYTGQFLTYEERADISQAILAAAEADDRGDQSSPMDRVWLIEAILSYEKTLERALDNTEQ